MGLKKPKFSTLSTDLSTGQGGGVYKLYVCILVDISFFDNVRHFFYFFLGQNVDYKIFLVAKKGLDKKIQVKNRSIFQKRY